MAGLSFDDLVPGAAKGPAAPAAGGAPAPSVGLSFDDLVPAAGAPAAAAPGAARPLTVKGAEAPAGDYQPSGADDDGGLGAMMAAGGYANNLVRQAANAVPILGGMANTLDGATASLLNGKSPDANKAAQDQNDAQFAARNPIAAGAAGFAGGAGGTVAMLPEAGLGMVGGMSARMAGAGIGGAALGGADASVRGQDPVIGATIGGLGGWAGPLAGKAAGAAANAAMRYAAPIPAALQSAGRIGVGWLRDGLGDATQESLAAARARLGPQGFTGEMTPGLLDLSGSIADNNGAGKPIIRGAYDARAAGTTDRVNTLVDRTLGPHETTALEYSRALLDRAKGLGSARDEMLGQAGPVDISPVVEQVRGMLPGTAENSPQRSALVEALHRLQETNPKAGKPSAGTWEPDFSPVEPVGAPPEAPPHIGDEAVALHDDTAVTSKPQTPDMPRPQALHELARSLGGIQDPHGDLASMGFYPVGSKAPAHLQIIAPPGKGLGPDAARQVAAEAGYLGADTDHAMASTDVNDLFGALGSDGPVYSVRDGDAAHAWSNYDAMMGEYGRTSGPVSRDVGMGGNRAAPPDAFDPGPPVDPNAPPPPPVPDKIPVSDPRQLHGLKQAFDADINYDAKGLQPSNPVIAANEGGYKSIRAGINDALRDAVPDYGPNQDLTHALMKQQRNVREGVDDLNKTANPVDYGKVIGALDKDEIAARRVGNRETVEATLGKQGNDFLALKNKLQGITPEGGNPENAGWNLRNLGTLFGQDAAEGLNTGLNQEALMKSNAQRVTGGSPTGEKVQRAQLTQPDVKTGFLGYLANMRPLDQPATMLPPWLHPQNIGEKIYGKSYEAARGSVAPLLVQQGEAGNRVAEALLRLRAQQGAMDASGLAPAADALTRALMGAGVGGARGVAVSN